MIRGCALIDCWFLIIGVLGFVPLSKQHVDVPSLGLIVSVIIGISQSLCQYRECCYFSPLSRVYRYQLGIFMPLSGVSWNYVWLSGKNMNMHYRDVFHAIIGDIWKYMPLIELHFVIVRAVDDIFVFCLF